LQYCKCVVLDIYHHDYADLFNDFLTINIVKGARNIPERCSSYRRKYMLLRQPVDWRFQP